MKKVNISISTILLLASFLLSTGCYESTFEFQDNNKTPYTYYLDDTKFYGDFKHENVSANSTEYIHVEFDGTNLMYYSKWVVWEITGTTTNVFRKAYEIEVSSNMYRLRNWSYFSTQWLPWESYSFISDDELYIDNLFGESITLIKQ